MLIPELAEQKGEKGEASGRFVVALQDLEPNTEVCKTIIKLKTTFKKFPLSSKEDPNSRFEA